MRHVEVVTLEMVVIHIASSNFFVTTLPLNAKHPGALPPTSWAQTAVTLRHPAHAVWGDAAPSADTSATTRATAVRVVPTS